MAKAQAEGCGREARHALTAAALALLVLVVPARAEDRLPAGPATPRPPVTEAAPVETVDSSLSPECRVPGSKLYTLARLAAVKEALAEKRPVKVLSVGSSSAGMGGSTSYPVRLESAIERLMPNVDVSVESRGLPGEIASGAAERLRTMLAEVEPDLVVWQVGMNDALARVDLDSFTEALDEAVRYVKAHDIDIVLIDPLFTQSLAADEYYNDLVKHVQTVATRERVPLVRRYEAMRFLSGLKGPAEAHMLGQQFRLNDLGLRCLAEHAARAITLSLLQSDPASEKAQPDLDKPPPKAVAEPDKTPPAGGGAR